MCAVDETSGLSCERPTAILQAILGHIYAVIDVYLLVLYSLPHTSS